MNHNNKNKARGNRAAFSLPKLRLRPSVGFAATRNWRHKGDVAVPTLTLPLLFWLMLTACGGNSPSPSSCQGSCANSASFLSITDVENVLAQGVTEASARGSSASIAVVDRVGNVLAVFRMNGAQTQIRISSQATPGSASVNGGLENLAVIPDSLAAISKAITGAYLSSEGNAFSTRTAAQIIQDHFNPGEHDSPAGPLFGVQFSQLPCSDVLTRSALDSVGPHRAPLGLSADAGGFPLYKNGTLVGGVGVISDGLYSLDRDPLDRDNDADEVIALAASYGFEPATDRRADRITADGKTLRYSDANANDWRSNPASAPAFAAINNVQGQLLSVIEYTDGSIRTGTAYATALSGIRGASTDFAGQDAFILVDALNQNRYTARAGNGSSALTQNETQTLLQQALAVANHTRAQIRQPLGSPARVSISVVDLDGTILGLVRSRDAPVFGVDVAVQKARSALLLSKTGTADAINGLPPANYLLPDGSGVASTQSLADYIKAYQQFAAQPSGLNDGQFAFSARAIGNLARPFYPDGIEHEPNGPLVPDARQWSVFNTGLQLDLSLNAVVKHIVHVIANGATDDTGTQCTGLNELANGLQIFPGGVPIYRNEHLIGAIGVSGDGVDQDDMIAFLGLNNASEQLSGAIGNAPSSLRSDQLFPHDVRLRYVQCPQAPFIDSPEQNVCDGK